MGLTTPIVLHDSLWLNSRDNHFYILDRMTGETVYTYKPLYHLSGFQNPPVVLQHPKNTSKYHIVTLSNQAHIYRFAYEEQESDSE